MAIKSFGLFWRRDEVDWNPGKGVKGGFRLLGRSGENLPGLRVANFREQLGIYILYGNHGPYYVGLTKKGELGGRLKNHLTWALGTASAACSSSFSEVSLQDSAQFVGEACNRVYF
jgi:hypothetical protein